MSLGDHVQLMTGMPFLNLYKPLVLSLPSNDDLRSLLASLSIRLTNRYLVTRIIQYSEDRGSSTMAYLYSVAKPFVWYRGESASYVSGERSGDELQGEMKGDRGDHWQVRINDIDEIKP